MFRILLWLGARLSRRSAYGLARGIASLLWFNEVGKVTRTNIAACFPELNPAEQEARARLSLRHMVMVFFEFGQIRYWSLERLLENVTVEGEALITSQLASGRGIILLVPHLGAWEILCVYLGHHHTVAALYDPPRQPGLEAEIKAARERFAGKMFPIGVSGMRSVIRELRQGGLVAILPDQVPDQDSGVYAPFFGRPALTMDLPFQLGQKTGAHLTLGVVERICDDDVQYRIKFSQLEDEPITDIDAAVAKMNRAIEDAIQVVPEQYQWEYKRFKRPPEGGRSNIYKQRD